MSSEELFVTDLSDLQITTTMEQGFNFDLPATQACLAADYAGVGTAPNNDIKTNYEQLRITPNRSEQESTDWSEIRIGSVSRIQERIALRDMVEAGHMPLLGNGFSFVTDTRPEGHEDEYIPAAEYTAYFSQGQIPVAAAGHKQREHDVSHMPSYITMFGCESLARLVRTAANNALRDIGVCRTFTKAMDGLGDCMRNLEMSREGFGEGAFIGDINGARTHLRSLVALYASSRSQPDTSADQALFDEVWRGLCLPEYAAVATHRQDRGGYEGIGYEKAVTPSSYDVGEFFGRSDSAIDLPPLAKAAIRNLFNTSISHQ